MDLNGEIRANANILSFSLEYQILRCIRNVKYIISMNLKN